MSSNIIFTVPGRTSNYMPVDVNTSKEALLEKYARESFSTENTWPYPSPSAGYYDIKNSDTKLILLNKRMTWSHLRGKTKAKREPFIKDKYYDWVEKEIEMKKSHEKHESLSRNESKGKRSTDPSRHFASLGCTFKPDFNDSSSFSLSKTTKSSLTGSRPRTSVTVSRKKEITQEERDDLLKYLYEISHRKAGLHDKTHVNNPPIEFLDSYNINHPELKTGQKLYINNLCQVYSVSPMKKLKQIQYLNLLEKQKNVDKHTREEFKMHYDVDFDTYRNYIIAQKQVPNQINCGYFDPRKSRSVTFVDPRSARSRSLKKSYKSAYESNENNEKENKKPDFRLSLKSTSSRSSSASSYSSASGQKLKSKSNTYQNEGNEDNNTAKLSDLSNTDYEKESNYSTKSNKESSTSSTSSKSSRSSSSSRSRKSSFYSKSSETLKTFENSKTESKFSFTSSTFTEKSSSSKTSDKSSFTSKISTSSKSSKSAKSSKSVSSQSSKSVSSKSSKKSSAKPKSSETKVKQNIEIPIYKSEDEQE